MAPPNPVQIQPRDFTPAQTPVAVTSPFEQFTELLYRHSVIAFALLFLLVGASGMQVGASYWSAHVANSTKSHVPVPVAHSIAGLNMTVGDPELDAKLAAITNQPASLTLGTQQVAISPATIRSWLQVTPTSDKSQALIHVKADNIASSLTQLAGSYLKAPVNQVTVSHDGVSSVVVAGKDGSKLEDPNNLNKQAQDIAKNLLGAHGIALNSPIQTLPFQAVTPSAFNKLIEVNVVTKQMYLYDNGSLSHTYPVSAGAAETPTPIGEYHIYSKLAVQDMSGYNPNGTKYFQPHVRWINYFLPGGYAVHGNYWRPQSWFGAINSSHGCVSLPDAQAKEVYDWAPIGTTVITHS